MTDDTVPQSCLQCPGYVDCKFRQNRMKKVKVRHGSNKREDIRFRINAMEWIAKACPAMTSTPQSTT